MVLPCILLGGLLITARLLPSSAEVSGRIDTLAANGSALYAAGWFVSSSGSGCSVALLQGNSWKCFDTALGGGGISAIGGRVRCLLFNGSQPYVVAGGFFGAGNGSNVALFSGPTVESVYLDGGVGSFTSDSTDSGVYALAWLGSDLYVGGRFGTAGSISAYSVAKWSGSSWSSLEDGIKHDRWGYPANVYALATIGTDLYVGGEFSFAGSISAKSIASWNGSAWSSLGDGVSLHGNGVYSLATIGSDLYVGGTFIFAGPVTAFNVAKWNGSAWSSLGMGVRGTVYTLAVIGSDLYVGGQFYSEHEFSSRNIAKWNGSSWSSLGNGGLEMPAAGFINNDWVYSIVLTSVTVGSDLYIGGYFGVTGGMVAHNAAKWNGSAWSGLNWAPSTVDALSASPSFTAVPSVSAYMTSTISKSNTMSQTNSRTITPNFTVTATETTTPSVSTTGMATASLTPTLSQDIPSTGSFKLTSPVNGSVFAQGTAFGPIEWTISSLCRGFGSYPEVFLRATLLRPFPGFVLLRDVPISEYTEAALRGRGRISQVSLPAVFEPSVTYSLYLETYLAQDPNSLCVSNAIDFSVVTPPRSLSCSDSSHCMLVAPGRILQRRWKLPGTVLSLPLTLEGLGFSSLVAQRASIVFALQLDFSRLININTRPPVSVLDVDVDWTRSGPTIINSPDDDEFLVPVLDEVNPSGRQLLPYPSSNSSTISISVFFSAAIYGGTGAARASARSAASLISQYLPTSPSSDQHPSQEDVSNVLPWTRNIAVSASSVNTNAAAETTATPMAPKSVSIFLAKDFAHDASSGFERSCSSFLNPEASNRPSAL